MAEITFLGTGGSVSTETRDNMCFLFSHDGFTALVDCPGSVTGKIKKAGHTPLEVEALLITHIHTDHVYGLPSLVHSLMQNEKRLRVYGSLGTIEFCRRLLALFDLFKDSVKYRLGFYPIETGEVARLSPSILLEALAVPHSPASLAFKITFEGISSLVYSGDTPVHPPLFDWARGIEYMIHDCSAPSRFFEEFPALKIMHTSSLDLGRSAQTAGVRNLIPCHLMGELEFPDEEIEGEIRRHFEGRLIVPQDFQKVSLG